MRADGARAAVDDERDAVHIRRRIRGRYSDALAMSSIVPIRQADTV
jgi:hypothetical protein